MRSASHDSQVLLRSLPTTAESAQPRILTLVTRPSFAWSKGGVWERDYVYSLNSIKTLNKAHPVYIKDNSMAPECHLLVLAQNTEAFSIQSGLLKTGLGCKNCKTVSVNQ